MAEFAFSFAIVYRWISIVSNAFSCIDNAVAVGVVSIPLHIPTQSFLLAAAHIRRGRQLGVGIQHTLQIEGQQAGGVFGFIGVAVHRCTSAVIQSAFVYRSAFTFFAIVGAGCQTIAHQFAVAVQKGHVPVAVLLAAAHLHKNVLQFAVGVIAPTFFVKRGGGHKPVPTVTRLAAVRQVHFGTTKTAQAQAEFIALRGQARLGGEGQSPAQSVQTINGVGAGHQGHALKGGLGQHVPIDHIAKRFVDTHTIHVHRQTLRCPQNGRGA